MIIISDEQSRKKAEEISGLINAKFLIDGIRIGRFKNDEIQVKLNGDFKGETVAFFKSLDVPDNILELFIVNDALVNAGAKKIINILPFIPYLRQDAAKFPGDPISSRLMSKFLEISGADDIITLDMHSKISKGHFKNVHEIDGASVFAEHLKNLDLDDFVIVSPDNGGEKRASMLAEKIGLPVKVIEKERDEQGRISRDNDKLDENITDAIIYDDIVDGGSTILSAAKILKNSGCKNIIMCCSHPVFSGSRDDKKEKLRKFADNGIRLITTDSLHTPEADNLIVISLSKAIAGELGKLQ